jgi:hypothetical protein
VRGHSDEDAAAARRNVERMQEQSEKLITGAGHGDDDNDPVVILGRRIGRSLGWLIAAGLMVYLGATYLWP